MVYSNKYYRKRGITYIEVISSLFIITIIFTLVFPLVLKVDEAKIDVITNKVISELKYAKSLAISNNSRVYVKFSDVKDSGYTSFQIYSSNIKEKEYTLPKEYRVITNSADLYKKDIVFNPDGTLDHRATTIKVRNILNKETYDITLTIGFTRIMRSS